MAQHQHGHLTEEQVIHICKSYDNHIMAKFKKDKGGLWYNERLENEVVKRKKYCESRAENKKGKKDISITYDSHMENRNENKDINSISIEVNAFLKRGANSNTMDVRMMVKQWQTAGHTDIMNQLKAMKAFYESNNWTFPNKIETLTERFQDGDWIAQLKDLDPERKAERIQKAINDGKHKPQFDSIGSSAPGALD